jgi:hypothetical protein
MITQSLCTSFKAEVLLGVHDFRAVGGDTFKIALYTALANLDASTPQYSSVGECTGAGYVAGGIPLTNLGVSAVNSSANSGAGFASFADAVWPGATLVARGALIYNSTPSATGADGSPLVDPAVCVLDFGADKVVTNGTFTVTFPASTGATAIVRIS